MNIIVGLPPNFEDIDAVFHIRRMGLKKLALAYGENIYQPVAWDMPNDYLAHESVHAGQQRLFGGPEPWWVRYLIDPQFRLEQEIAANRTQWRFFLDRQPSRRERRSQLAFMAASLSGPIYGHMITKDQAKREITANQGEY